MRSLVFLGCVSVALWSCSSAKVVPVTAAPAPQSAPPPVERTFKKVSYADSSNNGTLTVKPSIDHIMVLEHITVDGPMPTPPGKPVIRFTIWQTNGESLVTELEYSVRDGRFVYDQDVFHRLQTVQQAMIETFDPGSGDIYNATIKTSGYQETK